MSSIPLVTGFLGPYGLHFFLHISFISCPASWLSLPLLLPATTHLTDVCFTISIHSISHTDQVTPQSNCKFLGQRVITIQSGTARGQIASNNPSVQGPPCVFQAVLRENPFTGVGCHCLLQLKYNNGLLQSRLVAFATSLCCILTTLNTSIRGRS